MSDIRIARGMIDQAGELSAQALGAGTAAILTDETVDALWGDRLYASLCKAGWRVIRRSIPSGENSKCLTVYGELLDFLAQNRMTRTDAVFALGGGVVGDLAGFTAATYLRGVKLVQVPTTLLACVDSSVGGKTAIDLPSGKNLAGAFYQPHLVLIDPDTLSTLSDATLNEGAAEVVKYAAIQDASILPMVRDLRGNADSIIRKCVDIKKSIVAVDEKDTGLRQMLNFGHTFGHAVERLSDYAMSHGACVAAGMGIMARACAKMGLCSREDAQTLITAIKALGLPTDAPYPADALYEVMLSDKKRAGTAITLVTYRALGRCELDKTTLVEAKRFLEAGWAQWN